MDDLGYLKREKRQSKSFDPEQKAYPKFFVFQHVDTQFV